MMVAMSLSGGLVGMGSAFFGLGPAGGFSGGPSFDLGYVALALAMLAGLRQSHWDPSLFLDLFPALLDVLPEVADTARPEIHRALLQVRHLDVGGRRGQAIQRGLEDQLGVQVAEVTPFGLSGSAGSTPPRRSRSPGGRTSSAAACAPSRPLT